MKQITVFPEIREPSYVIGADGRPTAVLVDLDSWRTILSRLEDVEDETLLKAAASDLAALARGDRPAGWMTWEAFEAELEAAETAGDLPP